MATQFLNRWKDGPAELVFDVNAKSILLFQCDNDQETSIRASSIFLKICRSYRISGYFLSTYALGASFFEDVKSSDGEMTVQERIHSDQLLVLSAFGAERIDGKGFYSSSLADVLRYRVDSGKLTVLALAPNGDLAEIRKRYGDQVYSLVSNHGQFISCDKGSV